MNFPKRRHIPVNTEKQPYELKDLLVHNVMFYLLPPLCDIPLQEVEQLASDRVKILRIFESATAKYPKMSEDWKASVLREMNGEGLKLYTRLFNGNGNTPQDIEARRKDYLSHFILRFAYCRTRDLRHWFVTREMEMFWMKFSNLTPKDIRDFKKVYELNFEPVSSDEKDTIKEGLFESTYEKSIFKIDEMDFYKIRFTQVLDLVKSRRCFLKAGFAYISAQDVIHILGPRFEKVLARGLEEHYRMLPQLEQDERLWDLITSVHTSYTGKDYTLGSNDVAIENLDNLAKKSFPLCMRMCHDSLRHTHKLKHQGRLQYGLFIKGIGVTMEDSIRFFREEFTKVVDPEKFDKQYLYNIRYNYGKEGKRKNFTPYSCMKIIASVGGTDDVHGCPFKLFQPVDLKPKLISYGLSTFHAEEVVEYVRKGHYQIACSKYFQITHETKEMAPINHPNHFFEASQEVMGNRQNKVKQGAIAKKRGNVPDVVLKKKKLEKEQDDVLWSITQDELSEYYKQNGIDTPFSQNLTAATVEKKASKAPEPMDTSSKWDDDDDDLDLSTLDDSIAMQYM